MLPFQTIQHLIDVKRHYFNQRVLKMSFVLGLILKGSAAKIPRIDQSSGFLHGALEDDSALL